MSSIGQILSLLTNASADSSSSAAGSGQWFGGKGYVFAWADQGMNLSVEVSPDNGVTWFLTPESPPNPGNHLRFVLNEPALLVRATASGYSNPYHVAISNLNVVVIGYDDAE